MRRCPGVGNRFTGCATGKARSIATRAFASVLVYCVGPPMERLCGHCGRLALNDLPDGDWQDISAHLRCTRCGTVGYVDTRMDWSEVIDFNKGVG